MRSGILPSDPVIVKGLCVFTNPDEMQALSHSGELVWKTPLKSGMSAIATDGTHLLGATATSLVCLDVDTSSLLWEKSLWAEKNEPIDAPQSSSCAIAKDKAYVGSRNGSVYCVTVEDGTVLWEYQTKSPVVASPAVCDGKLFIGSTDGKLYCFGPNSGEHVEKPENFENIMKTLEKLIPVFMVTVAVLLAAWVWYRKTT